MKSQIARGIVQREGIEAEEHTHTNKHITHTLTHTLRIEYLVY